MAPRWPGVLFPWAMSRARASKMPAEKSSPSRTASENAVRRSAPLISSAMETSEFQTTVSVMGSILLTGSADIPALLIDVDEEMTEPIETGDVPRRYEGCRFGLHNERRTFDRVGRVHPVTIDDLAHHHAAKLGEKGLPAGREGYATRHFVAGCK